MGFAIHATVAPDHVVFNGNVPDGAVAYVDRDALPRDGEAVVLGLLIEADGAQEAVPSRSSLASRRGRAAATFAQTAQDATEAQKRHRRQPDHGRGLRTGGPHDRGDAQRTEAVADGWATSSKRGVHR